MAKRQSKDVTKNIAADWPAGVASATLQKDGTEMTILFSPEILPNDAEGMKKVRDVVQKMHHGIRRIVLDCRDIQYPTYELVGQLVALKKDMTEQEIEFALRFDKTSRENLRSLRLEKVFTMDQNPAVT